MLGAAAACEVHERVLPRRGGRSNVALIHPRSLELWHEWQRSRFRARSAAVGERLRSLRPGGASGQPPQYLLHSRKGEGEDRSEEHTSELQSRGHLVCRLLLEKK